MSKTNDSTFEREDGVTDSDLLGYFAPGEIVDDPTLTLARKRELLAFWASDIHAVTGTPSLRSYASGAAVSIDEILEALRALDIAVDTAGLMPHASSHTAV